MALNTNTNDQQDIIVALQDYTTCDVSDALQGLGVLHGGFIPGPTLRSPQYDEKIKIVGRAYTVQYASVATGAGVVPKQAGHYIDNVPSGSVVFIHAPDGTENAVYGGMMSRRARARGAAGTVVCGRVRDLQEHKALEYPVFANGIGTASPYGVVKVGKINDDIRVRNEGQDVLVRPGDYIIGDLNGVVCLPVELAQSALELMADYAAQDAKVGADLLNGVGFEDASRRHRIKK